MALLEEGQVVRDTYRVERLLGEGAFAEVYRVRHRFLGRQAMKVFKMVGMTIEDIEEMLGEASLLSRIGHPNIVRVFDANVTETSRGICGYFTMEYVAGGTLERFWRSHGAQFVPAETAVELIRQVCRGLAVAHAERPPIVHRDIKPQNILVGYDAAGLRARLSDFGLAKHVNPLTLLASARGTPAFKPPEVFDDPKSDSCAADVWSVGATLYLLLCDRLPYCQPDDNAQAGADRFRQSFMPPSRLNIDVDELLDAILERALSLDPSDRYQNAQELLADLAQWQPAKSAGQKALKSTEPWEVSKNALGKHSPACEIEARRLAATAVELSKQATRLSEAADALEEALNMWPQLREEYEYRLRLWRRGIVM